ncbi:MAG: hypothetical protein ACXWUL_00925 [Caldimonas sp.]
MDPIALVLVLLLVQAALGALDTFVNHEWRERLPDQPWAARELALHALRSTLYAAIFAGLAWLEWHGAWAWCVLAVMAAEYVVTIVDSVVEDRTRVLSAFERTNHMLLALNTGLYTAVYALQLAAWQRLPDAVEPARHTLWLSLPLTAAALAAAASGARDTVAALAIVSRRAAPR